MGRALQGRVGPREERLGLRSVRTASLDVERIGDAEARKGNVEMLVGEAPGRARRRHVGVVAVAADLDVDDAGTAGLDRVRGCTAERGDRGTGPRGEADAGGGTCLQGGAT